MTAADNSPRVIALGGGARITDALAGAAEQLGWRVVQADMTLRAGSKLPEALGGGFDIVGMLVDVGPVLLVVEVGDVTQDWTRLVTLAKTNPATRKIPILGVGPENMAGPARDAGCDAVLTPETFAAEARDYLSAHARINDTAALARQSALPLPEAARLAIEQFNAGEYFEQHESFEHAWRAEPGPVRQLYQGLLLIGVAFLQIQRRNEPGARKTFQRARQYLAALPDVCQGVDVARFRIEAEAARREFERLCPERIDQFDPVFFCQIHLVD
jgi:hypothetical protein